MGLECLEEEAKRMDWQATLEQKSTTLSKPGGGGDGRRLSWGMLR